MEKKKKLMLKRLFSLVSGICFTLSLFGCEGSEENTGIAYFEDSTLSESVEESTMSDSRIINRRNHDTVMDIDYNVYGIYLKLYPTYDENGDMITREAYEGFMPRDRSYNPVINCDVMYSDERLDKPEEASRLEALAGTIRVRGNSSRGNPMKNFKIKLEEGKIFGYDSININKHFVDETRALNKFCMDMMQLPAIDFVSMETKFVHLYINDVSLDGSESGYIDQGIYTFVEQPNKDFLKNHGLDPNGVAYKAMAFEFLLYDDEIVAEDDPRYDEEAYSEVIKPTAGGDHEGLRSMLDAVNNYSLKFEDVMDKYFDEENYLTWMAFNILLGNIDTLAHNFLLYSPSSSEKWYFLPWDFDGAVNDYGLTDMGINPYQSFGIHFYWSVPLHQRYFRIEGNVEKLNAKIDELAEKYLTRENVEYAQQKSIEVVLPFADDLEHHENPNLAAVYRKNVDHPALITEEIGKWYNSIRNNYDRYYMNLENPTSGNVTAPVYEDGEWVFRWEASYDFQHEQVTYDFYLATDPEFENVIASGTDLNTAIFKVEEIPKGLVYFQYIAKDSSGHIQYPLNRLSIKDMDGNTLVRKRGVGLFDNDSGEKYVIENEIFGDDQQQ